MTEFINPAETKSWSRLETHYQKMKWKQMNDLFESDVQSCAVRERCAIVSCGASGIFCLPSGTENSARPSLYALKGRTSSRSE